MGSVLLVDYDFDKNLAKYKNNFVKEIKGWKVKVMLGDKVAAELKKSKDADFLYDKMVAKASKVCDLVKTDLAASLENFDKLCKATTGDEQKKVIANFNAKFPKEAEAKLKSLNEKLKVIPTEQWKKFLAKYGAAKKEYKDFKIDCTIDIGIGVIGVAASGAAIGGAAHTGGASLVLGVIGMARSITKIANTCYIIGVDVKKYGDDLNKEIQKMLEEFKAKKASQKAGAMAKELGKAGVNALLGVGFFTTVSSAIDKDKAFGGKVAGAFVNGVKLTRELTKCKTETEKLEKKLNDLKGKDLSKAQAKLKKLDEQFLHLAVKASNLNAKAKECEKSHKKITAALTIIKTDHSTLIKVEEAMNLLVSIGLAAAGAGTEFAEAGAETVEIAKASITTANEIGLMVVEQLKK